MASKANWEDVSSHSQGDKDKTPNKWQLSVCGRTFTVKVHRHIYYPPDAWLVTCSPALVDKLQLEATDVNLAKAEAIELVRAKLTKLLAALPATQAEAGK